MPKRMNSEQSIPDRFLPPEPSLGSKARLVRWAVTLIALVVLAAVSYQGYYWFTGNLAQRKGFAAGQEPSDEIAVPPPVEVKDPAQSAVPSVAAVDPGPISNPDQRRAICGYLAAELERLDHEFKQPLQPPVVDRIATEIKQLRAQNDRYGCTPSSVQTDSASRVPVHRRAEQPAD
jgi:hypothetical protein